MKSSGIGGQAVLEGVMMKNKEKYAIAVRKPDNEITVDIKEYRGLSDRYAFFRTPVIRGFAALIDSMSLGIKSISFSSSFYDGEDNKEVNTRKESILTAFTFFLSIALAVGIFILLPLFLSNLLSNVIESSIALGLMEGAFRVIFFVGYVVIISQFKDMKRFFQYHGAEHKVINCIEHGTELTISNVRKQSKEHKRCGTSFMLFVVLLSVVLFMFIQTDQVWLRFVLRILLIPVISGIAYEIIRLAGRSNNIVIRVISAPGLWMQRLTTKEPDNDMIEVAIASVEAVFDWRGYLVENGKKLSKKGKKNVADKKKNQDYVITSETTKKNETKVRVSKPEHGSEIKKAKPPVKNGSHNSEMTTAIRNEMAAADEELSNLDKVLFDEEEIASQKNNQLKGRASGRAEQHISSSEIAASLEPKEDDEDDEILKALDRYLSFEKEGK